MSKTSRHWPIIKSNIITNMTQLNIYQPGQAWMVKNMQKIKKQQGKKYESWLAKDYHG